MPQSESTSLLPSNAQYRSFAESALINGSDPAHKITRHWHIPHSPFSSALSYSQSMPDLQPNLRNRTRHFLTSRWGHYSVLILVGLDVACILAGFLIAIFQCERQCCGDDQRQMGKCGESESLEIAAEAFEAVSLAISCLFMVELGSSIWAFGFRYLTSWFHILDATVIIAAFILDVCLKGVIEEAGSVIVVLRLWRVFKLIEELGAGAEERTDDLNEHIERLIAENKELRRRIAGSATEDRGLDIED